MPGGVLGIGDIPMSKTGTHGRNILVNGDFRSPFSAHEEEVNKGYMFRRPKQHHKRDLTRKCLIMSLKMFFSSSRNITKIIYLLI